MRDGNCTAHFSWSELACVHLGIRFDVPDEFVDNAIDVCSQLENLRERVKTPIRIHRCYSTPERNAALVSSHGAAPKSLHLKAAAADISVAGYSPKELRDVIEELIIDGKMKQGGLAAYKSHVHYDARGKRVRWNR